MKHFALHQWLVNADQFYIDAKILKSHRSVRNGSNILLWYAVEHYMKIVILQDDTMSDAAPGNKLNEIDGWIDSKVRHSYGHDAKPLVKKLLDLYPDIITTSEQENLKELSKFFGVRYVSFKPASMAIDYNVIDAAIFKIRDLIDPSLPESIIDKIDAYRDKGENIKAELRLAYQNNSSFHRRPNIGYVIPFDSFHVLSHGS